MHIAPLLKVCTKPVLGLLGVAVLLAVCQPSVAQRSPKIRRASQASTDIGTGITAKISADTAMTKTNVVPGEFIGPAIDCDGDGINDESRIVFAEAGVDEECVEAPAEIPEPPFQQTYVPTNETFKGLLPPVGWQADYICGDGLYEVSLSRPSEGQLQYSSQGLTLTSEIVYDDIDPNLNQPLVIQDPEDGLRYTFTQQQDDEFYEYALASYGGDIGLYIYETGEQLVAAPCETIE